MVLVFVGLQYICYTVEEKRGKRKRGKNRVGELRPLLYDLVKQNKTHTKEDSPTWQV